MDLLSNTLAGYTPGGIAMTVDNSIPHMAVSIQKSAKTNTGFRIDEVRVSNDTLASIRRSDHEYDALCDIDNLEVDGPMVRAMVKDAGAFAKIAKDEKNARSEELASAVDGLKREVEVFVQRVGEMRSRPTQRQAEVLGGQLGELRDRHAKIASVLQQTSELLEFAAVALIDTTELSR